MEKIKEKLKLENFKVILSKYKYLFFSLLITLLFLGGLYKLEFSRCTYRMYSYDYMLEFNHHLTIGRYTAALFWKFVNVIGFNIKQTYFLSFSIGILSITFAIYTLFNILKKHIKSEILSLLLSTAVVLNTYIIDYFIYIEKGVFVLSILLGILAFKYLIEFFETNKKKNIIISLIFLLLAAISYQGTVALFVALATIYIVKYTDSVKSFIKNNIITALIYGFSLGLCYVLVRITGGNSTSRTTGKLNIIENLKVALSGLKRIFYESDGTLPKNFFAITFALVLALVLFFILKRKDTAKRKTLLTLGLIYSMLGCTITALLPQLAIDTAAVSVNCRAIYPFASIIALIIIYLYINVDEDVKVSKIIFSIILVIYMSVQCVNYNKIIRDHYTLNSLEKDYAFQIGDEIDKYELETGNTIENIIFYTDKKSLYFYPQLISYADINERVFRTTWCRIDILRYYLNKNLIQKWEQNEEYKNEFENIDYDSFDKEQLKFEGDTLHLCIF